MSRLLFFTSLDNVTSKQSDRVCDSAFIQFIGECTVRTSEFVAEWSREESSLLNELANLNFINNTLTPVSHAVRRGWWLEAISRPAVQVINPVAVTDH
ncbi:hypothetical protein RRG08_024542 [Elysia crispata]|uniref:Uncharacterized protein n=1 Tax=Elysia crispata TaxID=231223 RepID=A0AAE0Y7K6_9GAST|nr:hypothetical protein RRG08_024542 [Elysia crispata]